MSTMQGVTMTVSRDPNDVSAPWSVYAHAQEDPAGSFSADLRNTGSAQMFFHGVTEGMRNAHIQGARVIMKSATDGYEIILHCSASGISWPIKTPGVLNNESMATAFAKGMQFGIGLMKGSWNTPIASN